MAYFDDNTTMSIYWTIEPTPGYAVKNISYDGIQQEIPTLPVFYNVVHVTSTVSLTAYQNTVIIDSPTTGETITLLSSSDPSVVPGLPVRFIIMDGASTSNLLAVQSGDSLNGVVDGTQVLVGQVSGIQSLTLTPTDIGWISST